MRNFILFLIVLSSFLAKAQDSLLTKKVRYCGIEMSVPADCKINDANLRINGNNQSGGGMIKQGNQFVNWTNYSHIPDQMKDEFVEQFLNKILSHLEGKMGGYKKKPKKFISLDQNLDGWLIVIKNKENKKGYYLLASGTVNSKNIVVYCGLSEKPKNNKAIPDFMSQIIHFR